jgi:hypothetical protein
MSYVLYTAMFSRESTRYIQRRRLRAEPKQGFDEVSRVSTYQIKISSQQEKLQYWVSPAKQFTKSRAQSTGGFVPAKKTTTEKEKENKEMVLVLGNWTALFVSCLIVNIAL